MNKAFHEMNLVELATEFDRLGGEVAYYARQQDEIRQLIVRGVQRSHFVNGVLVTNEAVAEVQRPQDMPGGVFDEDEGEESKKLYTVREAVLEVLHKTWEETLTSPEIADEVKRMIRAGKVKTKLGWKQTDRIAKNVGNNLSILKKAGLVYHSEDDGNYTITEEGVAKLKGE